MRFTSIILLIALQCCYRASYSQIKEKDLENATICETIIIKGENSVISTLSISLIGSLEGTVGIKFDLTTKGGLSSVAIRSDSLLLHFNDKDLSMNYLYSDSIYLQNNGGIHWNSIHFLNIESAKIIKKSPLQNVSFIIDGQVVVFGVRKKYQKLIIAAAKNCLRD